MNSYLLPNSFSQSPATYLLMLSIFSISIVGFYHQRFLWRLILYPKNVSERHEYYRLLTADFIHVDIIHLILNMIMMYVFCSDLEELLKKDSAWGSLHFLFIYTVSMVFSNVIITMLHKKDGKYSSAGASGSIMGCLFSFMLLDPYGHALEVVVIGGVPNIFVIPLYILGLIFYKIKRKNESINHELHFYGAVGGVLGTLLLYPGIL